jgi:hypothetical protein
VCIFLTSDGTSVDIGLLSHSSTHQPCACVMPISSTTTVLIAAGLCCTLSASCHRCCNGDVLLPAARLYRSLLISTDHTEPSRRIHIRPLRRQSARCCRRARQLRGGCHGREARNPSARCAGRTRARRQGRTWLLLRCFAKNLEEICFRSRATLGIPPHVQGASYR